MQQPFDAFLALLAYVKQRECEVVGAENLEPEFLKTLQFIKRHPDLRPRLVGEFARMLQDKSYGRYMLIQFCMHELRWPETLASAKQIYAAGQMALIRQQLHGTASQQLAFLEEVIASFDDTWNGRRLFKYYGGFGC